LQSLQISLQSLTDTLGVPSQPVIQPRQAALLEIEVQRGKARNLWDGHEEVASGIANQALNLALVVALARSAEAVEEQVMRLQFGKAARALAAAVAQDPNHRQFGVVIQDRDRHPAEVGERRRVSVEKGFAALGRIGFEEAGIRVRQVQAEDVNDLTHAPNHRDRLAEVGLGLAGGMGERDKHLLGPGALLAHIVLHDRVAAREAVLVAQTLINPLGRVPLLRR
jgi:hypothetical protein